MDYAALGFLKADRSRLRILEATKSKITKRDLSSRLRISAAVIEADVKGLAEKGLAKEDAEGVLITKKGMKLLGQISKQRI